MKVFYYVFFATLFSLWFGYRTINYLSDDALTADAKQNAVTAHHLVAHGVWGYSDVDTTDPSPTMQREPVPILAISTVLLLHPSFAPPYTIQDIVDGRLTKTIKIVNVFWQFVAALFIFLLCFELFSGPIIATVVALITVAISDLTFLSVGPFVDRLYTELPAAALLLATSWCAVRFAHDETKSRAVALGIAMGLLALTKAAFFYIGIIFIVILFIPERLKLSRQKDHQSLRQLRVTYGILIAALLGTLSPWVIRNSITNGTPGIVNRAEDVLGLRMLLAEEDPLGMIYFSSPLPLKQHLGTALGYSSADLEDGGRLDGIRFAKQRRQKIYQARMQAEGYKGNVKSWLRRAVFSSILHDPLRYAASIGVFAYRGVWFMRPSGILRFAPIAFYGLSALSVLCFLGVFFWGVCARNKTLIAAFGLGAGAFLFHAALTHGIPRYNAPLTPLVIISILWLCFALAGLFMRPRPGTKLVSS